MTTTYFLTITGDFGADPFTASFNGSMVVDNVTNAITTLTYINPGTGATTNVPIIVPNGDLVIASPNIYNPTQPDYIDIFCEYVPNTGFNPFNPPANFLHITSLNDPLGPTQYAIIATYTTNAVEFVKVDNVQDNYLIPVSVDPFPASNICFPANTPVTVDQGVIAIEKLDSSIHTINNKRIVAVTKTTSVKNYLVRLDKDALGENLPSETTTISPEHKIVYNGKLIKAKNFIGQFEHVYKVEYKGEILYNVLMDEYSKMRVNNLIVETLDPESDIAQLYNGNAKSKKTSYIMKNMMNAVINKDSVNNNNSLVFRR